MTARDRFELKLAQLFSVFALFVGLTGGSLAVAQGPLPDLPDVSSSPVGAIVAFGGSTAPPGWLMADGSTVSATQFPELCAVLGNSYGPAPAGQCTLPDLRGRIPAGKGTAGEVDALGDSDGLVVGSRNVKHRHGPGTLNITSSGGGTTSTDGSHQHVGIENQFGTEIFLQWDGAVGSGAGRMTTSTAEGGQVLQTRPAGSHAHTVPNHAHPNSAFAGQVGDTTGPLDGPAFQVVNYIIHAKPAP